MNAAVITTKNTLQAFNPRCVLVVGVAGGFGDLNLADVVVADRICAYEYGKVDRGFHPRPDLDSPTDAGLAAAARTLSARHPGWYSELDQPEEALQPLLQLLPFHCRLGSIVAQPRRWTRTIPQLCRQRDRTAFNGG